MDRQCTTQWMLRIASVIAFGGGTLLVGLFSRAQGLQGLPPDTVSVPEIGLIQHELSPAPVLTVSAGVLPTSPLAPLDRFDEWMERTVFTFGISRLRAHAALSQAAERVAELQTLESQGLRTPEETENLLREEGRLLHDAAEIAGNDLLNGGRPVRLVLQIVRTTIASVDALETLFAESGELAASGDDEAPSAAPVIPHVLANLEDSVDGALFPESAVIPPQLLQRVAAEKIGHAARHVERTSQFVQNAPPERMILASSPLLRASRFALVEAIALYRNGHYEEALTFARETRDIDRTLAATAVFSLDELALEPRAGERVAAAIDDLLGKGFLSLEEARDARDASRQALEYFVSSTSAAEPEL